MEPCPREPVAGRGEADTTPPVSHVRALLHPAALLKTRSPWTWSPLPTRLVQTLFCGLRAGGCHSPISLGLLQAGESQFFTVGQHAHPIHVSSTIPPLLRCHPPQSVPALTARPSCTTPLIWLSGREIQRRLSKRHLQLWGLRLRHHLHHSPHGMGEQEYKTEDRVHGTHHCPHPGHAPVAHY